MDFKRSTCPVWVHRYAVLTACVTLLLLGAGALVTGTGSGLAVPDWPLSYGQFFPPMIGGILFEHGHRMIAGTVAILMFGLAASVWATEPRRWVRYLALAGVGAVLAQATLGGMTVLFRLPKPVSIAHACLAQIFFSITVILALTTSAEWEAPTDPLEPEEGVLIPFPHLALLVSVAFFLQLLLGATMRHMKAGLAIPDFPTAFGGFAPPVFTPAIAVHFAHRMGALTVFSLVAWLVVRVHRRHPDQLGLTTLVGLVAMFVGMQVMLGAMIIWLRRPIPLTTIHLMIGALCLASSVAVTCRAFRLRGEAPAPRPAIGGALPRLEVG